MRSSACSPRRKRLRFSLRATPWGEIIECAAMKRTLAVAAVLLAAVPLLAQKRAFTLEDVYRVKAVSDLAATEDGSRIAFTVTTRDLPRAKSSKKIWIANADGSDMRAVTNGD